VRFLLPILALTVCSVPLRADLFNITLSGITPSGTGTFSTNGTCTTCMLGSGLLSFTINIGPDTGAKAFDSTDDGALSGEYDRATNLFFFQAIDSETGDGIQTTSSTTYALNTGTSGSTVFSGTVTVTPAAPAVPEPSSVVLLIVGLLSLSLMHRRSRNIRTLWRM
jgi:hypothetical protein